MLLTKEVEIKLKSNTVEYYKLLGYEVPMKRATESTRKKYKKDYVYDFSIPIIVKIEDLQTGSHAKVDVLCDYCQKNIITMPYKNYHNRRKIITKDACKDCSRLKLYESNLVLYNVKNASQSDEVKKRMAVTNIKKYGGIAPASNKNIRDKMKESSLRHYGVENPMQCKEVREKLALVLCSNGTHKTSRQQNYLFNLYKKDEEARMNYPISYYAADICLLEEKLVIEYDGGGHDLRVTLGQLTQEEFNQKEIIRNNIIKREGYKQIRIISSKDLLPTDSILFQMLSEAKQYFSETSHSWVCYDIDNSRMMNATNKDTNGIPYDFGTLRRIKDEDIENLTKGA